MFKQVAIIGTGLIGGSLARALREADVCEEIVGYSRSLASLQEAVDIGVIDRGAVSISDAVEEADVVVIATPVGGMSDIFTQLCELIPGEAVITDVGSVKQKVVNSARLELGPCYSRFVPGHPIAGTEKSGAAASMGDLFQNRKVVLTPDPDTDDAAVSTVKRMWEAAGAEVSFMSPAEHDRVFAACSHLPHVLAYNLVDMLVRRDDHKQVFEYAAGGFRDFTRIASSDPTMWRDICLSNTDALVVALKEYQNNLAEMIDAIEGSDGEWLLDTFRRAKHARDQFNNDQ